MNYAFTHFKWISHMSWLWTESLFSEIKQSSFEYQPYFSSKTNRISQTNSKLIIQSSFSLW